MLIFRGAKLICILTAQLADKQSMRVSLESVGDVSSIFVSGVEIIHMSVRMFMR